MSKDKVTVENLVDGGILEGFQRGSVAFLESLEDSLRNSVMIQESGDAITYLQQMIDEAETGGAQDENLDELNAKLGRVLNR